MTKDEALKLSMEAMEITGGFDVEINAIKEALAQPNPWEKFCDSNCVWTDHHPDCKLAEQKPVAWTLLLTGENNGLVGKAGKTFEGHPEYYRRVDVYTTPPQRKPLSDERIWHLVDIHVSVPCPSHPLDNSDWVNFARAIEAAHGIKGEA